MDSETTNPFHILAYTLTIQNKLLAKRLKRGQSGQTYYENRNDWPFKALDFLLLELLSISLSLYGEFLYFFKHDAYVEIEYVAKKRFSIYDLYQELRFIILHYCGVEKD